MKIPPEAKCVFKGIIFDVYQWEQKMFDGSTATFEMLKRPNTLQVIAADENYIYLGQEEQPGKGPFFSLFGGRQEPGEDPLAGAKRELLEESGLAADDWELLSSCQPYTKLDWTIYTYVARNCRQVAEPTLDPGEKISRHKVTFDEFIATAVSDEFYGRELACDILKMLHKDPALLETWRKKIFGAV
ncbi:MAG: NUDIX hydrolase [Candidatus Magasanikbacteria bacterium GW2011_GWA2_56_11]|uniref:NUDIX hydrolase n=1 Tax=Candidatus Magasanikbacteria bacterium GW2011_GWA2_56_11 TaxID=1619044 RepID=A0A0G1YEU8_9BACT|nr:MAG: NUDIX hydrolase [Candidatus Magasanikbacteria bacterium GW2011_GWA2_56_11]